LLLSTIAAFFFSCGHQKAETSDKVEVMPNIEINSAEISLAAKKFTLDNGLRVIVYEDHKLPVFSYQTFFDVGGRYEKRSDKTTGATHFLEHMMFKGSKNYGPGMFDGNLEKNGGSNNAYTSFDRTVYYENVPSGGLDIVIKMEADRMSDVLLEETSFESERLVILEERKMSYENSPGGNLYLKMMQTMFEGTPYGGSVIGDKSDVENLNRDQVRSFFKKFYAPNNAIVIVAGDVDTNDIMAKIKDSYGKIPASPDVVKIKEEMDKSNNYEARAKLPQNIKIYGSNPVPMFMMSYKGIKVGERKGFVMDILASILGDGASSYLNKKYVYTQKPPLTDISASNYTLNNSGTFFISGTLSKGVDLNKFTKTIEKESGKLCASAIDQRGLDKTKNQYMFGYYKSLQSTSGVASFLGLREQVFNDFNYYKKELEIYNSITVEELRKSCDEIFSSGKFLFVSIWDKHKKQSISNEQ